MVTVRPFIALRPKSELASQVSALPYDVMNHQEAKQMAQGNPYSFLHVSRPDIDLASENEIHEPIAYQTAKQNLIKMEQDGVLFRDCQPGYYLYRQIMNGRAQTGIVACVSVDEYLDNTIKKHELTRKEKELDRCLHFAACNAQTEPIFLAYRQQKTLNDLLKKWQENHQPVYDFVSDDKIAHALWLVDDIEIIQQIALQFAAIDNLYIADGHHRTASGATVCLQKRQEHPNYDGSEEFNYIMAVLFPDEELMIMDYNRVVADLNGLTEDQFLQKLNQVFDVKLWDKGGVYAPTCTHEFGLYLNQQWYACKAKPELYQNADPINRLDCAILQRNVLDPILGIKDPRTDKRIDFVGGIRGLQELEKRCHSDMTLAFALFPVTMNELFNVADAGMIMPPKSTWFEPKLRSGLFIHTFED